MKPLISKLTTIALYAGSGWVLVMMLLTVLDVTGRYFFSKPVTGTIEMSQFMLAAFGILGMAYTHASNSNIRVTALTRALPHRLTAVLDTVTGVFTLQLIGAIVWYALIMGVEDFHAGAATDTLAIPIYPLKFLLALGAFLMMLTMALDLWESIRAIFKKEKKSPL